MNMDIINNNQYAEWCIYSYLLLAKEYLYNET